MSSPAPSPSARTVDWESTLTSLTNGDPASALAVSRQVARVLERCGASTVRDDWGRLVRSTIKDIAHSWSRRSRAKDAQKLVERAAIRRFWGAVLDLVVQDDQRAYTLMQRTLIRRLRHHDRSGSRQDAWDDIAQTAAHQLIEQWKTREVENPWGLLCTILQRRFLDVIRGAGPDVVSGPVEVEAHPATPDPVFLGDPTEQLSAQEREIVRLMIVDGMSRSEAAKHLQVTPGQIVALHRSAMRSLYLELGSRLPPDLRRYWTEMFPVTGRRPAHKVAADLGISEEELLEKLRRAREILGC